MKLTQIGIFQCQYDLLVGPWLAVANVQERQKSIRPLFGDDRKFLKWWNGCKDELWLATGQTPAEAVDALYRKNGILSRCVSAGAYCSLINGGLDEVVRGSSYVTREHRARELRTKVNACMADALADARRAGAESGSRALDDFADGWLERNSGLDPYDVAGDCRRRAALLREKGA